MGTGGRVKQVSEPTFNSSAEVWAQHDFVYDNDPFKRVTSVITPTGTISNTYGKTSTVTLTVSTPDGTMTTAKESTLNDAGQKISSKVDEKEVTFTYYASGLPKISTPNGGQALTMDYDILGNRKYLNDPDAGIVESKYNGFGELVEEKQKVHNNTTDIITTNTYKPNGLLKNIMRNGQTTTYTYTTENRVSKIEISSTNKQEFTYDGFGRVTNIKETIGTHEFNRQTVYDFFGRVKKDIYPTGYYTQNKFDEYGNLTEVTDKAGRAIWKALDENARGQLTSINKGGKVSTFGFDAVTGLPTSTFASGVINYSYVFNNLGNLIERNDNNETQKEKFKYDAQNRLTEWDVYQNVTTLVKHNYITYNATTSNITTKSDLGPFTMSYGGNRPDESAIGPHALATISGVPTNFLQVELPSYPTAELSVTYTDFKKIATLNEKNKDYYLTYGVDDQRRMSEYKVGGVPQLTRYYMGDYEEEIDKDNKVRKIHYLSGAILIQEDGIDKFYYTYADYQGSLLALTDESGVIKERYAYDPWGARRDPDDWTQKDSRTTPWIINRGYTGHEHLDAFGIINMNGRVYDPLTAMFFSPDPALDGSNWLSYNRYGYCLGNPFKYTDPSGNNPLIAAAFIGGIINVFAQGLSGHINSFGDFLMSFSVGALAGLTGAWIGGAAATTAASSSFASAVGSAGYVGAVGGTAAGFVSGVSNAWMSGASFGDGLQAGYTGAGMGLIGGGIGGGISGGIQYTTQMILFMKGCEELGVNPADAVPATDKFTSDAQKAWYPDAPMGSTNKFTVENTGDTFTGENSGAGGATQSISRVTASGKVLTGRSNVYFNKAIAYSSARQLYNVMGHELIHVSQIAALAGLSSSLYNDNPIFHNMLEFHAYSYRATSIMNSFTQDQVKEFMNLFPAEFNSMNSVNFPWTSNTTFKYPF